jgi:hypothetical protein
VSSTVAYGLDVHMKPVIIISGRIGHGEIITQKLMLTVVQNKTNNAPQWVLTMK